jgi:mono/diheme cytochrome c family protein
MYDYTCLNCGKESLIIVTLKQQEKGRGGARRVEQERQGSIRTMAGTGACAFLLALVLASIASFGSAAAQDFPADVTRGKAIYERHCLACHGTGGRGDGPEAAALRVAPTNFHSFSSYLKSDEDLLRTIEQGVVFSPMHSWQGRLSETARQDVLAYIRLLVQQGR